MSELERLAELMGEGFRGINSRLDAVDARLDAMDRRFDTVDRRLDAMDSRLDSMDGRIGAMEGRLGAIERVLVDHSGKLAAITLLGRTLRTEVSLVAQLLTAIDEKMDAVVPADSDERERYRQLEARVASLEASRGAGGKP